MAVSRPQAVGRHIGVAHGLPGAFGDEIGKISAEDIEPPLPHVIFARPLDLKGDEPMEDVMRLDRRYRGNVAHLAGANSDVGGRRASTHRCSVPGQRQRR